MRAFNRLFVAAVGVAFALIGTIVLAAALGAGRFGGGTIERLLSNIAVAGRSFFARASVGDLTLVEQAVLLLLLLAGIVLLLGEFIGQRRHLVAVGDGAYITAEATQHEIEHAAAEEEETLDMKARVRAGSKGLRRVRVDGHVRRGADSSSAREHVEKRVADSLEALGIRARNIKVDIEAVDPRHSKVRVR
jgi:hypothetical protein